MEKGDLLHCVLTALHKEYFFFATVLFCIADQEFIQTQAKQWQTATKNVMVFNGMGVTEILLKEESQW